MLSERFCFFNGQECRFQLDLESQFAFYSVNNITNNEGLAGQILPCFTHLLNPIIIRFYVMTAVDRQISFWSCNWHLVNKFCLCSREFHHCFTVCDSRELTAITIVKNAIFISWIPTGLVMLGLWVSRSLQREGFFPFVGQRGLVVCQLLRSFKYLPKISTPLSLKGVVAHLYKSYVCTIFGLYGLYCNVWQLYIACSGNLVGIKLGEAWRDCYFKHASRLWITFCLCLLHFCKSRRYLAETLGWLNK